MPNFIDTLRAGLPLERLVAEHTSLKQTNKNSYLGLCPLHEEDTPSFCISVDKQLWYCHGCAKGGDVVEYLKLYYGLDRSEAIQYLAERLGVSKKNLQVENVKRTDKQRIHRTNARKNKKIADPAILVIVKEYSYTDENGNELFQCVRLEPKSFRQRRRINGKWVWNLHGAKLVPYNLHNVVKSDMVVVVEGEKDADNLNAIGFTATCNPMGAGKWKTDYNKWFKDKRVVIIPDNDKPGLRHAKLVEDNLKWWAKSVKVVVPKSGKDASDWIEAGATRETIQEEISGNEYYI